MQKELRVRFENPLRRWNKTDSMSHQDDPDHNASALLDGQFASGSFEHLLLQTPPSDCCVYSCSSVLLLLLA